MHETPSWEEELEYIKTLSPNKANSFAKVWLTFELFV